MMQQVFVIHGGNAYDSYEEYLAALQSKEVSLEDLGKKGWKDSLGGALGPAFQVFNPRMPNAQNAKYGEWKIWFEKFIQLLDPNPILLGHSLGGIFLAKYLSEETYPKKIKATFLIAAPYSSRDHEPIGDFVLEAPLAMLAAQSGTLFLFHSKDDAVVPFTSLERYRQELPDAHTRTFEDRGHFNTETFPELVEEIRALVA